MAEPTQIVLPTRIIPASTKSPRNLIIFSKAKTGKTSLCALLPNSLLLDFENGSDFVDAVKMKVNTVADLKVIGSAIIDAKYPYQYIIVDTITALEEKCIVLAEELYSKTSMGKSWYTKGKLEYGSILNMPMGAGYPYLRQAFEKVIAYLQTLAPRIVLLGHVKDAMLDKNGIDFSSLELDLTGKIKRITVSNSDGIGYMYRKGNKNILSFKTTDEVGCGARSTHLRNQEIIVSELQEDGTLITYWDKIFID